MKLWTKIFRTILGILLLAGILYAGWRWYDGLKPVIYSIPMLPKDSSEIVILGNHFGSTAAGVSLNEAKNLEILSWADDKIQARLPGGVSSGSLAVTAPFLFWTRTSGLDDFISQPQGLPSQPYGYQVPVQAGSPWPLFRRDSRNSGSSPLVANYLGDQPWTFPTAKGIFSTPIIDAQGAIYVGSADHKFYALNPDGSLKWSYTSGEIIDSAGALGQADPKTGQPTVTFLSGDGHIYHFLANDLALPANPKPLWSFEAELRPDVSFNRWFEGNVAVGPDGTLYAGNTNFEYYAVNPDGTQKWVYPTTSNNWSMAAFADDGSIYWASLDTYIRKVSPAGRELWRTMTWGFVAASAAVGSDGTVYIGSFDSNFYALDPNTGAVKWTFPTGDHIYSSAALRQDKAGQTDAVIFGSADGSVYAVSPQGKPLWRYDSGDTIRSSPAIGLAPDGSQIVYIGSGNGKLYALNAADGSLRWAYNTTPDDPELKDRNDLNGSPALGKTGIYIGGEHGSLVYVPYDFCLKKGDARCSTAAAPDLPADFTGLRYVTAGGNTLADFPANLPSSSLVILRLIVRQGGQTLTARLCDAPIGCPGDALQVTLDPPAALDVQHSPDGHYIYIRPLGFLQPGTSYRLHVQGRYYNSGLKIGNLDLGGGQLGQFGGDFSFTAEDSDSATQPPLQVTAQSTTAIEWTRLAAPLPTMLPSLNQIGFDYIDWIVGTVAITPPDGHSSGRLLLWAAGAKRSPDGSLVVDPTSDFLLPLSGTYLNDQFILSNQGFAMPITGINIPFNLFQMRGQLGADGRVKPGASICADTEVLSIPRFGPYLVLAGLANNWYQKMLVSGTYITRPYPDGPANTAPQGVTVKGISYQAPTGSADGLVSAEISVAPGSTYPKSQHRPAILLVNPDTLEAYSLDYRNLLLGEGDSNGNLAKVTLRLPKGTSLPSNLRAYVLLDVFPAYQADLTAK